MLKEFSGNLVLPDPPLVSIINNVMNTIAYSKLLPSSTIQVLHAGDYYGTEEHVSKMMSPRDFWKLYINPEDSDEISDQELFDGFIESQGDGQENMHILTIIDGTIKVVDRY